MKWKNIIWVALVVAGVGWLAGCDKESETKNYNLRVYGPLTVTRNDHGARIAAADADKARIVWSKIFADFTTLPTVSEREVRAGRTALKALVFESGRALLPVLQDGASIVTVYSFDTPAALDEFLQSSSAQLAGAKYHDRREHPYFLDLWDRHAMSFWYSPNRTGGHAKPGMTDDGDFDFFRQHQLGVNAAGVNGPIAERARRYDLGYKFNRWMDVSSYVYDKYPQDTHVGDPDSTHWNDYYGDVPFAENRLERGQGADLQEFLRQYADDDHLMSVTDPHGETGPGAADYMGWRARDESSRRSFIAYLRDTRQLTVSALGERWYGDAQRFKSWDDVQFPRERDFYGWQDGASQDLSGEWKLRVMKRADGEQAKLFDPAVSDANWFPFAMPGTEAFAFRFWRETTDGAWLRFTFKADANLLRKAADGQPVYLTVCPFNYALYANPTSVWFNGQKLGDLTLGYGEEWGQFDVTKILTAGDNTLTVFAPNGHIKGPRFLTTKRAEEFPTPDKQLNARLYDLREWVADNTARSNARAIEIIRGADADRPVKMMAFYSMIDVMMPWLEQLGGYPHCTGEGAYFRPWFKRFGYLRGIQSSAEPSGPAGDLRGLRRIYFTLQMEGGNALDYFIHLHSVTADPEMKAWFERNAGYLQLMGRFDLKKPEVAIARSWRIERVFIPWPTMPADSGYQNDLGRGDMYQAHYSYVYTSERELADGLLKNYRVIIDDNFHTLNPADVDNLEKWVADGGTLVLNQRSGRNTYEEANSWPIEKLTGCVATVRPMGGKVTFEANPEILKAYAGKTFADTGNVTDWQQHTYYHDSISLAAKDGVTVSVIARYEDGAPAIVTRQLGKGRVIVLGSAFYRDSSDVDGYYVGSHAQAQFYQHLLGELGVQPVIVSEQDSLWSERFVSNNGSTELLVLGNAHGTEPLKSGSAVWELDFAPRRVFDPVTGATLPVKIEGRKVTVSVQDLLPYDLRYFAVERTDGTAVDALDHWLFRQSQMWRAVPPGIQLQYEDYWPAQMFGQWLIKQFGTEAEARAALAPDYPTASGWTSGLNADWASLGLPTGKNLWAVHRKELTISDGWFDDLRGVELIWTWGRRNVMELWVNGSVIVSGANTDHEKLFAVLKPGNNIVTLLVRAEDDGNGGRINEFMFARVPGKHGEALTVNDNWTVYPDETTPQPVSFPAKGEWMLARKKITVPEKYRDCEVWLEARGATIGAVNGRSRYNSNNYGARNRRAALLINVTPDIKFGADNDVWLGAGNWNDGIRPGPMDLQDVKLWFIPRGKK
ncbi:MAG: beta-galactosidase trimerization domain-containing protein [Verrucomicrobiales bacterium]|jgi:hypothetical protein|nr:beta-galactosidase trimerization domain-containing protein [Verrucomicrobiales bacterium]